MHPDEAPAYASLAEFVHESVHHSSGEYVRGPVHTNGVKSFGALFKRGYYGTYLHMSVPHLRRHPAEFSGRHNSGNQDTAARMRRLAQGPAGHSC